VDDRCQFRCVYFLAVRVLWDDRLLLKMWVVLKVIRRVFSMHNVLFQENAFQNDPRFAKMSKCLNFCLLLHALTGLPFLEGQGKGGVLPNSHLQDWTELRTL
jgi:hypothetical protein